MMQLFESYCPARIWNWCLTRIKMDSQGTASGLHRDKETFCVPFSRMAGVSPGQALVGMQRVRGWHRASMNVELWRFICSWEKASEAQTKRSAGTTCSGDSGIEFPSQKGATAAGWPRRRIGAGGSRAGFRHGLSCVISQIEGRLIPEIILSIP